MHGQMDYLERHGPKAADPIWVVNGARSIVVRAGPLSPSVAT